jgi:PAS domain S-box-containing protein
MSSRIPKLSSLSAQMILSFIALVLLTAAAVGLPALWLIRSQLHRQALAQIGQGSQAAQALYEARENELSSLATLTAQRPTLHELLLSQDEDDLPVYLDTLQKSLELDLVLICGPGQRVAAKSSEVTLTNLCDQQVPDGFHVILTDTGPQAWLFATHPLVDQTPSLPYAVLLGQQLDDQFAIQMKDQTGLEHTVLVEKASVASSLPARQLAQRPELNDAPQDTLNLDGRPYYIARFPLGADGIESEVALEITDVVVTQRQLAWTLFGSILVVTVVASVVGTFLARRISSPLAHLAEAAGAMSRGDLDTPMTVDAGVREVALVAQALDGARADLKRTLTELRQEKAWTDHLLESIVEGIVTLDRQGRITFFSHGAEQITGWRRDEVLERSCDHVFHPIETDRSFSQLIPAPGRRQKISIELRDGNHAILAVTGGRLLPPARGNDRVALVFRDVSEEEAIHRLLGHFLANVAHEFRTPLSALAASVELLLDQAPDLSPAELEELLTSLHLGVLSLQTLIDNLLESASIETGHFRVHPRPSNLGDIIADAVSMMQPLLDKHGQRLVVELPVAIPTVRADPRRTIQVVINLLSNASKYGPDDAEIEVTATLQGQWTKVTVSDSGPGVPPEEHKNLFRRFVYTSPTNDKAQVGVGLGLSVVKAIIEGHGGEVGVDLRQGGGSAFWFTLPLEGNTETTEDRA